MKIVVTPKIMKISVTPKTIIEATIRRPRSAGHDPPATNHSNKRPNNIKPMIKLVRESI